MSVDQAQCSNIGLGFANENIPQKKKKKIEKQKLEISKYLFRSVYVLDILCRDGFFSVKPKEKA